MRFIGHLDLVRVWERAVRRAGLPLAFTEGFSPRPKLHFGAALPTCFASTAEYLDLDVSEPVDPTDASRVLSTVLPEGVDVVAAAVCLDGAESLQASVTTLEYAVTLQHTHAETDLQQAVARVLAARTLPYQIERKGRSRTIDLREGILDLKVLQGRGGAPRLELVPDDLFGSGPWLWMRLAAQPRSCRPTEVLDVLDSTEQGRGAPHPVASDGFADQPYRPRLCHRSAQLAGGPDALHEPLTVSSSAADQETIDGAFREETPAEPASTAP